LSQTSEDIRDNIVKIIDDKKNFKGTGFFIDVKGSIYCITCHHCICRLDEIYIEAFEKKYHAEWIEELSNMSKDIAIMKVENCNVKHLKYVQQAMAQLPVSLWGYSDIELEIFPQGAPAKKGSLSDAEIPFKWKMENVTGNKKWNKKPEVNVNVFQYDGKFKVGNSGSPVCYTGNNNVIGVFAAKDDNYGWVIPMQTVLAEFEVQRVLVGFGWMEELLSTLKNLEEIDPYKARSWVTNISKKYLLNASQTSVIFDFVTRPKSTRKELLEEVRKKSHSEFLKS
jgi:Trypsin-like peptidase domain